MNSKIKLTTAECDRLKERYFDLENVDFVACSMFMYMCRAHSGCCFSGVDLSSAMHADCRGQRLMFAEPNYKSKERSAPMVY